ncbi:hypothetical protein KZ881_25690, partial [Pseudomonas aeruginosa]|nr:hypothetical protein [Pseudomonas aeruginosa]
CRSSASAPTSTHARRGALRALGQRPPAELAQASASEALAWGIAHWDATRIPRCATLPEERL